MTTDGYRLPGHRERPDGWKPPSTTAGRSWEELLETMHGGLAILDDEWHLTFVSDRFLTLLGHADDLVGHDLREILPALTDDDPRQLREQFLRGTPIEFEQQFQSRGGDRCCYRVTMVPSTSLGEDLAAVVFSKDITETSRTLAQLREATLGLTEVESELHRRVGREVHDGPIQLLSALMFRLGMSQTVEAIELQHRVSDVASTLRHVIEEFSPAGHGPEVTVLEQWIAPFLVGSNMTVAVKDRRTTESSLAEAQAAFVMVYQVVRAARDYDSPREIKVVLTDEHGGQRIAVTIPSMETAVLKGHRAVQKRAIEHHARALGGTVAVWLDDNGLRNFSMWIPKLARSAASVKQVTDRPSEAPRKLRTNDVSLLPQLRDSTWREIVGQAPERTVEFDDHVRVMFSNAAQEVSIGVSPDRLIGVSIESMFPVESLHHLAGVFDQLDLGEVGETEWERKNLLGDSRLIRLTASPRLDEAGRWVGALVVTDDRTDVDLLDELYQTALSDLSLVRRRAIEASIQRLEQPLVECESLLQRIEHFERATAQPTSTHNITLELASTLSKIKNSTSVLGAPHLSISDLDIALRESLGPLLAGRQLLVVDQTDAPPRTDIFDVVFRIAREAVNNAVLHGDASVITVTLADSDSGVSCEIHDTGVGVDPAQLHHRPGHLGTRAMQERARERGGTCGIEPDSRGGTLVSIWLPIEAQRPSLLHNSPSAT